MFPHQWLFACCCHEHKIRTRVCVCVCDFHLIETESALIYMHMIYLEYVQIIYPSLYIWQNGWENVQHRRLFNTLTVCLSTDIWERQQIQSEHTHTHHKTQFHRKLYKRKKNRHEIRMLLIIWLHAQNVIVYESYKRVCAPESDRDIRTETDSTEDEWDSVRIVYLTPVGYFVMIHIRTQASNISKYYAYFWVWDDEQKTCTGQIFSM